MATQLSTHNSDDDDDNYVPPAELEDESSESEPQSKRPRVSPLQGSSLDVAEKTKAKDALWASFQASVSSALSPRSDPVKEMVKVEKRFRFAGETILAREVVEVPADSPDAKKWPLWHEREDNQTTSAELSPVKLKSEVPSEASSEPLTSTKPTAKRRKSKTTLAAIPTRKTKLSTLEKSAMDWQAHVQASEGSGLKDELEANRRGGGYLEKIEFLNRVDERREGVIETHKGSKRRRN
ncbi:hypothetical protein C0995_012624 [Termitomyces sp. Mi166|nr:hypothetical protein C0995_012624 [Termitomyces sp. Mi166\